MPQTQSVPLHPSITSIRIEASRSFWHGLFSFSGLALALIGAVFALVSARPALYQTVGKFNEYRTQEIPFM